MDRLITDLMYNVAVYSRRGWQDLILVDNKPLRGQRVRHIDVNGKTIHEQLLDERVVKEHLSKAKRGAKVMQVSHFTDPLFADGWRTYATIVGKRYHNRTEAVIFENYFHRPQEAPVPSVKTLRLIENLTEI